MAVHRVWLEGAQVGSSCTLIEWEMTDSLRAFYDSLASVRDTDDQPARKRQRTDNGRQDMSESDSNKQVAVNACLIADNTFHIETVDAIVPFSDDVDIEPVPVLIKSVSTASNTTLSLIGRGNKKQESITLFIQATGPEDDSLKHLYQAAEACQNTLATPKARCDKFWCECLLVPPTDEPYDKFFKLQLKIFWKDGSVSDLGQVQSIQRGIQDNILSTYLSADRVRDSTPWSPQDFYSNVYIPNAKDDVPPTFHVPGLISELYPFQSRAVRWLLEQEGKTIDKDGSIVQFERNKQIFPSYRLSEDACGKPCYISHLLQDVRTTMYTDSELTILPNGGILAEEMGLGKTVELVALICLHRHIGPSRKAIDPYTNANVVTSGATLIITPPSILEQWKSELATHAPNLKVWHYPGIKSSAGNDDELKEKLLEQDVVLATYGVLAREIHYANKPRERNLRHEKVYQSRRSPLVQILWWRVCLDEAQMVESGVSNAATVARMIPRQNAWAVSGTPLRKDVKDLLGLLIFLRYSPFCLPVVWQRMLSGFKDAFVELFGRIALRHTKSAIRKELHIPTQKRIVITVPFTAIEEQHYTHLFQQMCDDCGLDNEGGPLHEDWDPNNPAVIEKMRSWLVRLRQTCLHAEVGIRNRRALGQRDGPLRTVDEVLDVMIDQNETALRNTERIVIMSKVTQGHLQSFGKEPGQALEVYLQALDRTNIIVKECREQLAQEKSKTVDNVAKLIKPEIDGTLENEEDDESEDKRSRLGVCRQRLRTALETQHVCIFFAATTYFQLKEAEGKRIGYEPPPLENKTVAEGDETQNIPPETNNEDQIGVTQKSQDETSSKDQIAVTQPSEIYKDLELKESESYEIAKSIRKELLSGATKKAVDLMKKLSQSGTNSLIKIPRVSEFENLRGIESRKIIESINLMRSYLNEHAAQLEVWREKLVELLSVRLLDQDEDIEMSGEEYEASTKQQDEQYVYFEAFRAAIADRHCMITGQVNELIKHELKEAAKLAKNGTVENPENRGHAPELMLEVLATRSKLLPPKDKPQSLRHIMSDVRSSLTSVQWQHGLQGRSGAEARILEQELANLQEISNSQTKVVTALEKELDLLRSTMNQRLEFYRQLQQISDMVAPLQEEMSESVDTVQLDQERRKESTNAEKLASLKTKRRFLNHLKEESSGKQEQRICIICQSTFETGVLTVCGHQYCKECITLWWGQHRNCPMCKTHLKLTDFHDITYKPREIRALEERQSSSPDETSPVAVPKSSIYSDIPEETLNEIKSINLPGSFGTKIDTLARHLLWIRENDPGAKSIIFSQYRDFLEFLGGAFDQFKIGHSSIGSKLGIQRFREDPAVECFLLHAKADSSGLNLVNATHVFLCEPLINTAIELQAIARVHRIGQRRSTTVWMYLVTDTVEEAIYDISVSRRLTHMQKAVGRSSSSRNHSRAVTPAVEEVTLDTANSIELQTAPMSQLLTKGHSGGELVAENDLWSCLFSKPRRTAGVENNLEDAAGREIGRFWRAEAAERRRDGELV